MQLKPQSNRRRRNQSFDMTSWYSNSKGGDTSPSTSRMNRTLLSKQLSVFFLCFMVTFLAYVDRVGFSIAFTKLSEEVHQEQSHKGAVLSSFYWGYATSQIPCAWFANKFGGVRMLTASVLLSTFAAIITPGDANQFNQLCFARVIVGIAQGAVFPSIHTELAKWKEAIGPNYFSTAVSLITSGMYLGSAMSMLGLPQVAEKDPVMVFHLQAFFGVVWLVGWWMATSTAAPPPHPHTESSSPHRHQQPPLSPMGHSPRHHVDPEKGTVTAVEADKQGAGGSTNPPKSAAIPWMRLLSSLAIWALVVNNFAFHYVVYVLMAWLPTYYEKGLKMNMAKATFMNCLPFVVMFVFSNLSGVIADRLIGKQGMAVGKARKLLNTGGFSVAAFALMLLPAAESPAFGTFLVAVVLGSCAVARGGFALNHLDVAPTYAGSVMSVANTAGTIAGIIGVGLTGLLLNASGGESWHSVFSLLAAICGVGVVVFLAFASGERLF